MTKRTRKRKYTPKARYTDPNTDVTTAATGLLVDEEGVPYPQQQLKGMRKCAVRRRTPEQRKKVRERISMVRRLLSIGTSRGDIKRECARLWGISERGVEKYYEVARKWNLEILETTPEAARSDSFNWWTSEIRAVQSDVVEGRRIMAEGRQMISECQRILRDMNATPEARVRALDLMVQGGRIEARGRRIVDNARGHAVTIRRHFDRLLGVDAPVKVALVGDDGKSVLPSADQVLEGKALDAELAKLAQSAGIQLLPTPDAEQFPIVPDDTKGAPIETTANVRPHTTIDRTVTKPGTHPGGSVAKGNEIEHLPEYARQAKRAQRNGSNGNGHAPPEVIRP